MNIELIELNKSELSPVNLLRWSDIFVEEAFSNDLSIISGDIIEGIFSGQLPVFL